MKIGDYVRTKNGMIAKIIDKKDLSGSLHNTNEVFILSNRTVLSVYSKKVKKYSSNIIDLIEAGDFVNGYKVIDIYAHPKNKKICIEVDRLDYNGRSFIDVNDIKSIVTKEQFESMEYKVVE